MVLSDRGIKQALEAGELEITPEPTEHPINQYTTSAVANRTIICQLVFERLETEPGLAEPTTTFQRQTTP